jgi:hypothetical protein
VRVYNYPRYYELAFSYRDIRTEVDFIETAIQRYSRIPVQTILELASGNSPHMEELSRRGYSYVGLELNEAMIAYARSRISHLKTSADVVKGDMSNFSLTAPFDCALVFLGSFYIRADKELENHLKCVAMTLRAGGLYILDAAVSYFPEDMRKQTWEESSGGVTVHVTYDPQWMNREERLMKAKLKLDIEEFGKTRSIEHSEIRKIYSIGEFRKVLERTERWQLVHSCSDFDIQIAPKATRRNITILRRV